MDRKIRQRLVRLSERFRRSIGVAQIFAVVSLCLLLFLIWTGGYAFGNSNDSWGHIEKAQFLADTIRDRGVSAFFDSAWKPTWYMGDPYRTYYPPLTLVLLTPLALVFNDPLVIHHLFTTLAILCFGGLTFLFLNRQWGNAPAFLGSALAIWAPYQLRTLFFEGNYPRALAIIALPMIALLTEMLLDKERRRIPMIGALALTWCWAILAHPQQALMFAICFALYILSRLFLDPDTPLQWAGLWLGALVLGAMLSAPWALPAYSRAELSNVPFLPVEKVLSFTSSARSFLPAVDVSDGRILFGFGLIILALLATTARPDPKRTAFTLSGLFAIWLSVGNAGVVFGLLPLSDQLLPERFLNYAVFALAVAAAGLVPFRRVARAGRVFILLGLFLIDIFPSIRLIQGSPYPQESAALTQVVCQAEDVGCRTALMTYPEPTSQEVYFSSQAGPIINGWALENTPHNETLRRYLGAATWSHEYLQHLFGIWNVTTAILQADETTQQAVAASLSNMNYAPRQMVGEYQIWETSGNTSPVQVIPGNRALVIGAGLPPLLMTYPFAQPANQSYLSDLGDDIFTDHPVIILSKFEGNTSTLDEAENRLSEYIQSGGTVVMDLSGMETTLGRSTDVFDVDVLRLQVAGEVQIRWQDGLMEDLPSVLSLSTIARDGWAGAVYDNLDVVLAEIQYLGEWYPVLGYRDIGQGRAWFIGMNLLYYAQVSGSTAISDQIRQLTIEGIDVNQEYVYSTVPVENWIADDHGLNFDYIADEDIPQALISYTYSPRWRISVDGEEVEFSDYENLVQLSLPSGQHHVEFSYQAYGTIWPILGLGVGMLSAGSLTASYWLERSRLKRTTSDSMEARDRPEDVEYTPCDNCGFRLVESKPPTAVTYPFEVYQCPICGNSMTDEGYQPGRVLNAEQRSMALVEWLKDQEFLPVLDGRPLVDIPHDFFKANGNQEPDQESNGTQEEVGSQEHL